MVCGGAGFFLGWLTLATAYRDREHAVRLADNAADVGMMLVRPVIDLRAPERAQGAATVSRCDGYGGFCAWMRTLIVAL